MKKNIQYILGFLLGFLVLTGIVFAANIFGDNFDFDNNDVLCESSICVDEDEWKFNVSDLLIYNSETTTYRGIQYRGILQGMISSHLYGDFITTPTTTPDTGLFLEDIGEQIDICKSGQHTYKIHGKIYSTLFGELETVSDKSYLCPASSEAFIVFTSPTLPKKIVLHSGATNGEEEVERTLDVNFEGTSIGNIFEKQQVLIIGTAKIKGSLDGLLNESGNVEINEVNTANGITPLVRADINKKVAEITRNLVAKTPTANTNLDFDTPAVTTNGEKVYYYDYTNITPPSSNDNGNGNKGYIVKIQENPDFSDTPSGYKVDIPAEKQTIIVQGANVYINADIHNTNDKKSLLTIVTQRDKNNNGGNIYIDPDVTNIDAILIADGSVLSYDGTKILNRSVDKGSILARQLYVYGAIYSRNTIGSKNIPFGSDDNLFSPTKTYATIEENIYDLSNIRGFQMRFASPTVPLGDCGGKNISDTTIKRYWVPGYTTDSAGEEKLDKTLKYAWAGKRECFNNDVNTDIVAGTALNKSNAQGNLRTIGHTNSLIIEYNPAMKSNIPYVLQK